MEYISALAIADTISLISVTIEKQFMKDLFGLDFRAITPFLCKLFRYVYRSTRLCSSALVVFICIERFIAVWFPFKVKSVLSQRFARASTCCIYIVAYSINIQLTRYDTLRKNICLLDTAALRQSSVGNILMGAVWFLNRVLPTILLLSLTTLTFVKLYYLRARRRETAINRREERTNRTTAMLVCVVIAFIILVTTPSLANAIMQLQNINVAESKIPWVAALREVQTWAEQINYSANFVLYNFMSYEFRAIMYNALKCARDAETSYRGRSQR